MDFGLRPLAAMWLSIGCFASSAAAHTPVDFLEVIEVQPGRTIEHAVELKTTLDGQRSETNLSGPHLFARAVGGMDRPVKKQLAYMNWFKIVKPESMPVRELTVLDMVRGSKNKRLKVSSAEYLVCPSQRITSGPPQPVPDGLDFYKAYRVVDPPSIDLDLVLTDSLGPAERKVGKPVFVCVAAQQWHHEEHVQASHPNDCFVVYSLDPQECAETFTTIDQFGLNELRGKSNRWLCARAALLRSRD